MKSTLIQHKFCLTEDHLHQFDQDGFTVMRGLVSNTDLQQTHKLLTSLFQQFKELPKDLAHDLSEHSLNDQPRNPEIAHCLRLKRQLAQTQYFHNARAIARQLLGLEARLCFDHAILKPPYNCCPTHWHQDAAYEKPGGSKQRVSFWLPLQDVTEESGCLQYIPGSHNKGLLPHHPFTKGAHALAAEEVNTEQAVSCPVNAGDCIIHAGRTLHYAGPNITAQPRLAWILDFAVGGHSSRARLLHAAPILRLIIG